MNRLNVETRNKIIDKFKKELEESSEKEIISSTIEEAIEDDWQGKLKFLKIYQNYKSVEKPDITIGIKCNEYGQLVLFCGEWLLWDVKKSKVFKRILDEIPKQIKLLKEETDKQELEREEIKKGNKLVKETLDFTISDDSNHRGVLSFDKEEVSVCFNTPRESKNNLIHINRVTIRKLITLDKLNKFLKVVDEIFEEEQ